MSTIRYTLLSDGSSDRMLMPIIDWLFRQHCPGSAISSEWADLRRLPYPPKTLAEKVVTTLSLYDCDILFVHRDAEKESYDSRVQQISDAMRGLTTPPVVRAVPVRMQEAWLLFDEAAIRKAAGNPNGSTEITLPAPQRVENHPDPKELLFSLLRESSGLKPARLKKFNVNQSAFRVSQYIDDFSPLRILKAFKAFEEEIKQALAAWETR